MLASVVALGFALTTVAGPTDASEDRIRHLAQQAAEAERAGRLDQAALSIRALLSYAELMHGPDHPSLVDSLGWLATIQYRRGRLIDAERLYRRIIVLADADSGLRPETLGTALNDLGQVLKAQGKRREAKAALGRSLRVRQTRLGPKHAHVAATLYNLAAMSAEDGQLRRAISQLQRAIEIWRRSEPDAAGLTRALERLARLHLDAGSVRQAVPLFREVLQRRVAADGPEAQSVGISLVALAEATRASGDHQGGEWLLQQALAIVNRSNDPVAVATVQNNLGQVLFDQGRYRESEPLFRQASAAIERELSNSGSIPSDPAVRDLIAIRTLNTSNLANVLARTDRRDEALALYRRAVALSETTLGNADPAIALYLNNLGELYRSDGQPEEAERVLRRALVIFEARNGSRHPHTATALNNLALALDAQDRRTEAQTLYRQAIEIRIAMLPAGHPDVVSIHHNLAWSGLMAGDFDLAVEAARKAAEARRSLGHLPRAGQPMTGSQVDATRDDASSFVLMQAAWQAAQIRADAGDKEQVAALRAEAFRAAQERGDSAVAAALRRAGARIAAGRADLSNLIERRERLLRERDAMDRRLAALAASISTVPGDGYSAVAERRDGLDAAIGEIHSALGRDYPAFFDLIAPSAVDVSALQESPGSGAGQLRDDEALVVLTSGIGPWRPLVFAVTSREIAWAEIPMSQDEISDRLRSLRAQIDGGETGPFRRGFDRRTAHEMYRTLFGAPAIAALLDDKPNWILVPQGPLVSMPFAALVTAPPTGADASPAALRSTSWLGLGRALSMLPSVSSLASLRNRRSPPAASREAFFGLGDPAFQGVGAFPGPAHRYFRGTAGDPEAVRQLARLPGTRREVLALAEILGADPASYLLGTAASEANLLAKARTGSLSDARIVLLATHGLLAGEMRHLSEPALALTPPAVASSSDDGLLTASEAARLRLSADWLILSACNTAAGDTLDHGGLGGLARAFFYAGAGALLVSHWRVRDDAAQRLTTKAVATWQAGAGRARALQAAMRALIQDTRLDGTGASYAHPAAWAPFTVIGVNR